MSKQAGARLNKIKMIVIFFLRACFAFFSTTMSSRNLPCKRLLDMLRRDILIMIYLVREHSDRLREVRAAKLEKARSPSRTWTSALAVCNICTVKLRTDKVFFFSFETIIDLELRRITHEGIVSEAEVCKCLGIG